MFSKNIVSTDAFLDMPSDSQLLYFHLAMEADDDGFVSSPKKIMKQIGAQDDSYKILIAKRFVIPFESGVCVIKHWLIHNLIRHDRYNETTYKLEKDSLQLNEFGAYTEKEKNVIPVGNQMATQVRLGKDRLVKLSIDKNTHGEFENVKLSIDEYPKLVEKLGEKTTNNLIEELSSYMASKGKKYASHYATILAWHRRKSAENKNPKSLQTNDKYKKYENN